MDKEMSLYITYIMGVVCTAVVIGLACIINITRIGKRLFCLMLLGASLSCISLFIMHRYLL